MGILPNTLVLLLSLSFYTIPTHICFLSLSLSLTYTSTLSHTLSRYNLVNTIEYGLETNPVTKIVLQSKMEGTRRIRNYITMWMSAIEKRTGIKLHRSTELA